MPIRRTLLIILLLAGITLSGWWAVNRAGYGSADCRAGEATGSLRVLFIGNSLTQYNDLPGMVQALSMDVAGRPTIHAEALVGPGTDLGDHWRGAAQRRIAERWDWVVLQQGPSSLPESRELLLEYARTYAPAIREAGAEPAFYMVWPEERHAHTFDRACDSYRLAAAEVDGLLLPAGEAWRSAWRGDAEMPLYGADRFHPSPLGTYLAALVITSRITGRSPLELPDPGTVSHPALANLDLSTQQIRSLKEAAAEAIERESPQSATRPAKEAGS